MDKRPSPINILSVSKCNICVRILFRHFQQFGSYLLRWYYIIEIIMNVIIVMYLKICLPLCIISRCSQRMSPKNGGASATNRSRPMLHNCLPFRAYSGLLLPADDDTNSSPSSASSSLLDDGDLQPPLLVLLLRRRRPRRTRSRMIWLLRPIIVVFGLAVINFGKGLPPHTTRRSNGVGGGSGTENSP